MKRLRNTCCGSLFVLTVGMFALGPNMALADAISMTVINETQPGFSGSWLHAASGCNGNGFYMCGSHKRFTPMVFDADWNGNRLTIGSSTGGQIIGDISETSIQNEDVFSFTGGVLERNADSSVQGFIEYEITRAGNQSVDSGMFFIWPDITFAGYANSFTSTDPIVDLTTWSNNWVNGNVGDWSFLETLDSNFAVTFDGTKTTAATFNGNALALSTNGLAPSDFTRLGLDLIAEGLFTPDMYSNESNAVPEPSTIILMATGLVGMIGWRQRNRASRVFYRSL